MEYSFEQKGEIQSILSKIYAGTKRVKLVGRAGTGKTTVLREIVGRSGSYKIIACAPTNNAVDVLRKSLTGLDIGFFTVASLLKSTRKIDYDTGKMWFEPSATETTGKFLIICDEGSMLAETDVLALEKAYPTAVFLFVGDKGQLPPINDENYCVFDNLPGGILTHNFRCGNGNSVFDFQERLYQGDLSLPQPDERISFITRDQIHPGDLNVTFHNNTADAINRYVFEREYGSKIQTGISLIARSTFKDLNGWKVFNAQQFKITKATPNFVPVSRLGSGEFQRVAADLKIQTIESWKCDAGTYKFLYVADPKLVLLKSALSNLKMWREFYALNDYFPDVRLGYATTAHCTQGLTLKSVNLVWDDLMGAPEKIRQALLYVAASRVTDSLKILRK